jgi:hypothetical protein
LKAAGSNSIARAKPLLPFLDRDTRQVLLETGDGQQRVLLVFQELHDRELRVAALGPARPSSQGL